MKIRNREIVGPHANRGPRREHLVTMSRVLGIVAVYVAMFLAWLTAGLLMVFAPARIGNLIHDSFGLYPRVGRKDWGRKFILQLVGAGLIAFALRFAFRVAALTRHGG